MIKLTKNQKIAMVAAISVPTDDLAYGVIRRGKTYLGGGRLNALTEPGIRALTQKGLVGEWRQTLLGSDRVLQSRPVWLDQVTSIKLNATGLALARGIAQEQSGKVDDWQPEQVRAGADDEGRPLVSFRRELVGVATITSLVDGASLTGEGIAIDMFVDDGPEEVLWNEPVSEWSSTISATLFCGREARAFARWYFDPLGATSCFSIEMQERNTFSTWSFPRFGLTDSAYMRGRFYADPDNDRPYFYSVVTKLLVDEGPNG